MVQIEGELFLPRAVELWEAGVLNEAVYLENTEKTLGLDLRIGT